MKNHYPQFKSILLFLALIIFQCSFAQKNNTEKAEYYLQQKGELTFSIIINDISEIEYYSKNYSIVNYNPETGQLKLWANQKEFEKFLNQNISFIIEDIENLKNDNNDISPDKLLKLFSVTTLDPFRLNW